MINMSGNQTMHAWLLQKQDTAKLLLCHTQTVNPVGPARVQIDRDAQIDNMDKHNNTDTSGSSAGQKGLAALYCRFWVSEIHFDMKTLKVWAGLWYQKGGSCSKTTSAPWD